MASWRQCAGALYVLVDSKATKTYGAPHAASEGQAGVIPVKIIHGEAEPFGGLFNHQQLIGALRGCRHGRPRHCCTADFLQLPQKAREFTCRQFLGDEQDGLKLIPYGSSSLPFRVETSAPFASRFSAH